MDNSISYEYFAALTPIVSSSDFITNVLPYKGELMNSKKPKHHKVTSFLENFHSDIIFNKLLFTVSTEATVFAISCQRHGGRGGERGTYLSLYKTGK